MKTGILLINLGTPDQPDRKSVSRYLTEFLTDGRVIDIPWLWRQLLVRCIIVPFRAGSSARLYKKLWTKDGSPIKHFGMLVRDKLSKQLGSSYIVELAMRYQQPSIDEALQKLIVRDRIDKLIVLPLFPQYASATTGSVMEAVLQELSRFPTVPDVHFIRSFHDHPDMIRIFAERARTMNIEEYDHFLFSFHGLPVRQLTKSDPGDYCRTDQSCCPVYCEDNKACYSAQCYDTAHKIASELQLSGSDFTVCFQSRLGKDPWTQPYTSEVLKRQVELGRKKILVFSPAFVADCLETTIEIEEEYREEFIEMGGDRLDLVPSLNDHPDWITALKDIVVRFQTDATV